MALCGGTGAAKPADAEVQAVCDLVTIGITDAKLFVTNSGLLK